MIYGVYSQFIQILSDVLGDQYIEICR